MVSGFPNREEMIAKSFDSDGFLGDMNGLPLFVFHWALVEEIFGIWGVG